MEAVAQTPAVRAVLDHPGMPQNFLSCDRDQPLLLPSDMRDWLLEDHLAWFVIEKAADRLVEVAAPFACRRQWPRVSSDRRSLPFLAQGRSAGASSGHARASLRATPG
jgi:hypothetical protein